MSTWRAWCDPSPVAPLSGGASAPRGPGVPPGTVIDVPTRSQVKALDVNILLVVESQAVQARAKGMGVRVVGVPSLHGAVRRGAGSRQAGRQAAWVRYFRGPWGELHPHLHTVPLASLQVWRLGDEVKLSASMLPLGTDLGERDLHPVTVKPGLGLTHTLLAVTRCCGPEELLGAAVAGWVWVQEVDVEAGTLTYLAPNAEPLPGGVLMVTGVHCSDI